MLVLNELKRVRSHVAFYLVFVQTQVEIGSNVECLLVLLQYVEFFITLNIITVVQFLIRLQ